MIELRNVAKRFGEVIALQNINLSVSKGEVFTLIGPNGSGKTTILRIMSGIEKPTSGELHFNGRKIDDKNRGEVRKDCSLVFQKTTLFNTTVEKNVAFGLELRGMHRNEIEKRTKEVLEIVKLSDYEKRHAKNLSGGEQQRISLARALALEASVLLLDEPTANLDPKNTSIIEEAISRINKDRDTTIIIATHNMFQVESLAERTAFLQNGMIAEIGTASEVTRKQSDNMKIFTRLENVFSGISEATEGGTSIITLGNGVKVEAALKLEGKVMVFVRPENIILSKNRLFSSARNTFRGKITRISDLGSILKLIVNVGEPFVVQITKKSFREMGLNIGSEIFLTFKASSIRAV